MTYVGELGWELTVPTELATNVWDRLVTAGSDLGLRLAGYYAINALRLDKGYRAFGPELGPDRTPVEAGLTFTCDLTGDRPFVGREVVERQRAGGRPAGSRPSSSTTRMPCCGVASCCCATAAPWAR